MKNVTKGIAGAVTVIVLVLQSPQVQALLVPFLGHHPNLTALVAGIAAIIALIHDPKAAS